MKKVFDVKGMTCASCVSHVEKAVKDLNGINSVNVNLLSNRMEVDFDENNCSIDKIITSVKKAGYKASIKEKKEGKKEKDYDLIKLIVSFVFLILLMYVSMGHMINLPMPSFLSGHENSLNIALTQLFLTIPIMVIYYNYIVNGFKMLFKLSPNMNSLIALSAMSSLIYGLVTIFYIVNAMNNHDMESLAKYHNNLYFESAGMIFTLVSLGKYFEKKSKKKTTLALTKLMDLAPKTAVIEKDNLEKEVPLEEVKVNDIVVCRKGDSIPIDGKIVVGNASINQANITGESLPVSKQINDQVYASTIVTSGFIKIKANKVGEDTSISNIIRLVDEASSSKAPISKLVDKVSSYFVPIVMLISLLSFVVFKFILNYPFEEAFNFACSTLVVACPCALGLATPVAIMVGTGKGAECSLLISNAEVLEKAQYIKTVVLDKTGTLTMGKPQVTDVIKFDDKFDEIAHSLEYYSEHPLAEAINNYYLNKDVKLLNVDKFVSLEGKGLKGNINKETYYGGNLRLIRDLDLVDDKLENIVDKLSYENKTAMIFASSKKVLGIIAVTDLLKPSSIEAIAELKKMGIEVVMLTGDNKEVANNVAKQVGIDKVYSEVFPEDKQKLIQQLKKDKKHLVSMVGDGVNDSIALASSDLGISLGGGSDIAKEASDIVLLRNDLLDVKNVILLSKRVFFTIKLNLFWAFFYNCIGIILASGLLYPAFNLKLNPMISSLMMSISSVFVVCNSLTINLFKVERSKKKMKEITLNVEGMMCEHCVKHVKEALEGVNGVEKVEVSLKDKKAVIKCLDNVNKENLIKAVSEEGYSCK